MINNKTVPFLNNKASRLKSVFDVGWRWWQKGEKDVKKQTLQTHVHSFIVSSMFDVHRTQHMHIRNTSAFSNSSFCFKIKPSQWTYIFETFVALIILFLSYKVSVHSLML